MCEIRFAFDVLAMTMGRGAGRGASRFSRFVLPGDVDVRVDSLNHHNTNQTPFSTILANKYQDAGI